jgi:serpin B
MRYKGDKVAMLIILPKKKDGLSEFEKTLSAEKLAACVAGLQGQEVEVYIPKFKSTQAFKLGDVLKAMGMPLAFDDKHADFSGMNGVKPKGYPDIDCLYISEALHKAFVEVDEKGTEAAAATAIIMSSGAAPGPPPPPPPVFRADHPFVFLIRDVQTGGILFMGRVMNPKE